MTSKQGPLQDWLHMLGCKHTSSTSIHINQSVEKRSMALNKGTFMSNLWMQRIYYMNLGVINRTFSHTIIQELKVHVVIKDQQFLVMDGDQNSEECWSRSLL